MKNDSSATRILFRAIPVLLAVAMLVLVYLKAEQIRKLTAELATEQIALQTDTDRVAVLENLKSREAEIREQYEKALEMIPKEPMEESLINDIQQKTALVMADFVQIKFSPRVQTDNYVDMPLDISFSGNYAEFVKLLESLKNGRRAIRIDKLTVSVLQEDSSNIKADIMAHSFCLDGAIVQQQ